MNPLDKLVGFFAPRAGLERARHRLGMEMLTRRFDGARKDRRTAGWLANGTNANSEALNQLPTLRNRARELYRNNPYWAQGIRNVVDSLVGSGIRPRVRFADGDKDRAKELQARWDAWANGMGIDADGQDNWVGLQHLALKTWLKSGSVLVRRIRRDSSMGLAVPLQLELLEPDHLYTVRDRRLNDGGRILGGIEFGADGRRLKYHLLKDHPGDLWHRAVPAEVDAANVLHVYQKERPGQVDGIPLGVQAFLRARDLGEMEDTELTRAKLAACYAAFVTKNDPDAQVGGGGSKVETLEPGAVEYLEPGEAVTLAQPPTTNGFEPFVVLQLRAIAISMGMTYEIVSGDYSRVNYSSGRMAWLAALRNLQVMRSTLVIPKLCEPVWAWFAEVVGELADGALVTWSAPRQQMIDPSKETAANREAVACGFTSRSAVVAELGGDAERVDDEQAEDAERERELGLSYFRQNSGSPPAQPLKEDKTED